MVALLEDTRPAATRGPLGAKGVFAAVLGNGYEFFDFGVFAAYLGILGQTFFPADNTLVSDLASAATFGVGFFARPLGGALIGAYGDRAGRKPAMTLTIGLMALGSGLIAVLPGYATIGVWAPILLVLARLIQGFAVGGEMGPSTMFMIEAAPPGRRLFFASWQLASQNLGTLSIGLVGFLLAIALPKSSLGGWGWRIPFALGILIAPIGIYIRTQLQETLEKTHASAAVPSGGDVARVVLRNWRGLLLGLGLISGATISQYFLINMTPYAIRTLHLPDSAAMLGSVALGVSGALGALAGGLLADRFGIKPIAIFPRVLLWLCILPAMKYLVADPSVGKLVAVVVGLSALQGLSAAPGIMLIPLIFPRAVRSTGLALTYALGVAVFGGTATYIVTWLVGVTGDPLASVYYVLAANLICLASIVAIRETSYEPGGLAGIVGAIPAEVE
jgi:MFS family permease